MAIESGSGEYASIDNSDKKSSTPANSEVYQKRQTWWKAQVVHLL
jgi:hypothetical protein